MQFSLKLDETSLMALIRERLLAMFGPQRDAGRLDPLSQLVNAMLSTRTQDIVSLSAFERLAQHYSSWDALANAPTAAIEPIIRPVTYAEQKAVHLPQALRKIRARQGGLDLEFLADWDEEMALQWLRDLPGVGPKVAATVLNFSSLRRRVFAVDTHLLRIGARFGLLAFDIDDYDEGHDTYARLLPDEWDADDLYEMHWLMKYLGQQICTHAAPACSRCPLRDLCPGRTA